MKRPEQALQISCVEHLTELSLYYRTNPFTWFKIDNEGKMGAFAGVMKKRMGLKKGMPDLGFINRGITYYFEFKADKGKTSQSQKDTIEELQTLGINVFIIKDLKDFDNKIISILHKN